jgi:glucose-1-phosphate cytidylyltransferase
MKTIILCGGFGTRLGEETNIRPKPMVEIGGQPIVWHIMKSYAHYQFRDFVLALGFKGHYIKDYFLNYHPLRSNLQIDLKSGSIEYNNPVAEDWRVHLIDTGPNSMTGGRLYMLRDHLKDDDIFMLTYGDGVSDVNIHDLVTFHKKHGKKATMTAVRPPARFGTMLFDGNHVTEFKEKPQTGEGWINGGFFVFNRSVLEYLNGPETILEKEPLERLAADNELVAYKHTGFWQCIDTLRDKNYLESLWQNNEPPWKVWS